VDLETGENFQNHWVRSGCLLGNTPCNGLLYVSPHHCGCYMEAKLVGYNALAPLRKDGNDNTGRIHSRERLLTGPAFDQVRSPTSQETSARLPWPTYRHDVQRSGVTDAVVGTPLQPFWKAAIGTRPSSLTIGYGKVYVADIDSHTVRALDADDGQEIWHFTAGGRVLSPPTLSLGLAIFGSTDGLVYALRAADGELVWRFLAAPRNERVMAFDQLESPWPVPGVLVQDGKCWFAAGRSSYIDDGITVYAVDVTDGSIVHEQTVYSPDPESGKMEVTASAHQLPGLLNDIPSSDGTSVFIRQMNVSGSQVKRGTEGKRVASSAGYLDSSWFNRTFWTSSFGKTTGLMIEREGIACGLEVYGRRINRESLFTPGEDAYRLICRSKRSDTTWEKTIPIRGSALLRAGEVIFVAGSPDLVDAADPHGAWEGRQGGRLAALAIEDGKILSKMPLPAPPVWDGMVAAEGSLFISTMDGNVLCLAERK
jgi:outer membrane protein assembly factor BamB